jgi:hypothetical protein
VYHPVTQFIPAQFPILLIAPALVLDLFWRTAKHLNKWMVAGGSAILFVGVLLAVEWPFASFLQSPMARNAFFGADYMGYFVPPQSFLAQHRFLLVDTGLQFWLNIARAIVFAFASTFVGLLWGGWMQKVKR